MSKTLTLLRQATKWMRWGSRTSFSVIGIFISRTRRITAEIRITNAIEMMMSKTAEVNAARRAGISMVTTGAERVTAEMTAGMVDPRSASFMDMKNFATIGKDAFSTRIASISIQTKQKSSSTSKPMGPTRSTEKFTMPGRKPTGAGILMGRDADSKAVAEAAGAEGGTKVGVVFRAAAGAAAAGGTKTKGIANKEINIKGIIIKATTSKISSSSKGTIMTTIMDKVGEMDLPWGKAKEVGVTITPTKEGIRTPTGIILWKFRE